jgi:acetolactate synthase regulatory subunit
MLVVVKARVTPEQIQAVCGHTEQSGFRAHSLPGARRADIGNRNLPRGIHAATVAG